MASQGIDSLSERLLSSTLAVRVTGAYKLAPLSLNYFPENGDNGFPSQVSCLAKIMESSL